MSPARREEEKMLCSNCGMYEHPEKPGADWHHGWRMVTRYVTRAGHHPGCNGDCRQCPVPVEDFEEDYEEYQCGPLMAAKTENAHA